MIKRKLLVAGMTAFAITTATGIAALASQGNVNRNTFGTGAQNQYFAGQNFSNQTDGVFDKGMMNDNSFDRNDFSTDDNSEIGTANNDIAGQGFKAGDNEMLGQSFDKADNNSDKKPVLPRKSDEEAMKERNPKPALPEGVSVEDTTSETDNELQAVPQMTDANQSNKDDKKSPMRAEDKEMIGQSFDSGDNEMSEQSLDTADNNSDEKPVLPRKSDEEAMKEGNPKPALPEGVSVEDTTSETDNELQAVPQMTDANQSNKDDKKSPMRAEDKEMIGQSFDSGDNEMSEQSLDTADNNSDEKPVLPRKSDEEAMKEGNPKPTLPTGVTVDDADVLSN